MEDADSLVPPGRRDEGAWLYLGEPEEVLHEGAAVGVVHLHDGNLLLGGDQ